jgi:hypothetical protein
MRHLTVRAGEQCKEKLVGKIEGRNYFEVLGSDGRMIQVL